MRHQPHTSLPSHEVLLSLPQPSLALSLFSNTAADAGCTTDSPDSVSNVQNLIVNQVRPIRYGPAVETSQGTSDMPTNNVWNNSLVCQINQTKINNPMRCEVCKIYFNSKSVFEDHLSREKHRKNKQLHNNPSNTIVCGTSNVNFQIQDSSVQGQELFVDAGYDLKSEKRKLLSRGETEDDDQVDLTSNNGIGRRKIKVAQPARCEICMINCNTNVAYITHLSGKKHLRNLKKLSKSKSDGADASVAGTTAAIVTANDEQLAPNPAIESQEKSVTNKQENVDSYRPENAVILEAPEKDTETHKRKHELEGGTSITSAKFCTLSNVNNERVFNLPDCPARCEICMINCNSKHVYISHLSGKKHKKNLEKVSKSKNDGAGASVAGAVAAIMRAIDMQQATNQAIEPQEMLETSPQKGMDTHKSGNVVMLEAPEKDIETKRRKIEPFGGAATTYFKACELCNVPCSSEAVFNSHLHGKKHAAMLKKLAKSKSSWWF